MTVCADMVPSRAGAGLEDIAEALGCVEYFFPNADEAVELTGADDERRAAAVLSGPTSPTSRGGTSGPSRSTCPSRTRCGCGSTPGASGEPAAVGRGVRRRRVEQLPPEHLRGRDHAAGAAGLGEAGDVRDLPGRLALADEGALALPLDQQAVLAELLNGATDHDSAHSVGGGRLRLGGDLLSRPEVARRDGGTQGLGDLREEGLRACPLQRDLRVRPRGIHSGRRSAAAAHARGISRAGSGRPARPTARRPAAVRTGPDRRRARCARAAAGGAPPARRRRPRGP